MNAKQAKEKTEANKEKLESKKEQIIKNAVKDLNKKIEISAEEGYGSLYCNLDSDSWYFILDILDHLKKDGFSVRTFPSYTGGLDDRVFIQWSN